MFDLITQEDIGSPILRAIKDVIDSPLEHCKKWKLNHNQVVLKSNDCFYKIYINKKSQSDYFLIDVREAFAKIYNDMGLIWEILKYENENYVLMIEKREPVEVCNEINMGSFENLLSNYNNVLKEVEKYLELKKLTLMLKPTISSLCSIRLLRECVNKYIDYGITKNNDVILLDDSDFYLVMANNNGDTILVPNMYYKFNTNKGQKIFMSMNHGNLDKINNLSNKWILTSYIENDAIIDDIELLKNKTEQMFSNNLKFLTTGKCDTSLYVEKSDNSVKLEKLDFTK